MKFTTHIEMAEHIIKVYETFADRPSNEALDVLERMIIFMQSNRAVIGFAFMAKSREEYSSLDVKVEINKTESGWEMESTIVGGI